MGGVSGVSGVSGVRGVNGFVTSGLWQSGLLVAVMVRVTWQLLDGIGGSFSSTVARIGLRAPPCLLLGGAVREYAVRVRVME